MFIIMYTADMSYGANEYELKYASAEMQSKVNQRRIKIKQFKINFQLLFQLATFIYRNINKYWK